MAWDDSWGPWLALGLAKIPRLALARLLQEFKGAEAVLCADKKILASIAGEKAASSIAGGAWHIPLKQARAWFCARPSARLVLWGEESYPPALAEISSFPWLLWAWGDAGLLLQKKVAVVGSRQPTPAGARAAREIACGLAEGGFVVVSGMARGCDAAAHEGALEAEGGTIAVLGSGLDRPYPRENEKLFGRIAQKGLLLSEFPLGTPPLAQNFPLRNRIIAGLSLGVVVAEAAHKSGSLITARLAADFGREVFAVPGSVYSSQSRGAHALIKDGAALVESADDVLLALGGSCIPKPAPADAPSSPLLQVMGYEAMEVEEIAAASRLPLGPLLEELMRLEMEGWVTRVPGGRFLRMSAP